MNDDKIITTKNGLDELKSELKIRLSTRRKEIADEIERAREQGDLSENAAYTSAIEDKEFNETRITELEELISNSVIEEIDTLDAIAGLGEKITVERKSDKKVFEFILVGENEADPSVHKISIKSPIGAALFGKRHGDSVEITLPTQKENYKIIKLN